MKSVKTYAPHTLWEFWLGRSPNRQRIFLLIILVLSFSSPAFAKEKNLGTFGAWKAYAYDEGGQTVCYMVTTKAMKSGNILRRAPAYLMITHRPIEASTDVVSYDAGTLLASSRGVKMHIGQASFDFFSVHNTAWARDALVDHKIAAAIQHTATAQITAFPAKKGATPIKDVFDLTGAEPAYHAIGKACGLPLPKSAVKKPHIPHLSKHK